MFSRYNRCYVKLTSKFVDMPLLIEDWDKLFSDTVMTVAAIDRLIHHAKILQCKGESYKRKQAQNKHKTS